MQTSTILETTLSASALSALSAEGGHMVLLVVPVMLTRPLISYSIIIGAMSLQSHAA